MNNFGLYLHVPFCVRKCAYCDFVSYAGQEQKIPEYFEALLQEFVWYEQGGFFDEYQPSTIYFGGGTPSLACAEVSQFLKTLSSRFPSQQFDEVTLEINPGTVSLSQLRQVRNAGVNRVSLGIQSLRDDELRILGRIHTGADASTCFKAARQVGFRNISIDLMFGLPDSTLTTWETTLRQALELRAEHISLYNLTVEEGTRFWQLRQDGKLHLPDEEAQLAMYRRSIELLKEAGYEHYEISNFALPGHRSRHNRIYWRNDAYLGLGAGAHSYIHGTRYANTPHIESYIGTDFSQRRDASEPFATLPPSVISSEHLEKNAAMGETVMMNLRLLEGIDLAAFQRRFGISLESFYRETLDKLQALALIEVREHVLRLTPRGLLLSNEVFQEFLQEPTKA